MDGVRRAAAGLFNATCVIRRYAAKSTATLNTTTGLVGTPASTVVYEGDCHLKRLGGTDPDESGRSDETGDLALPWDVDTVAEGDIAEITVSRDTQLTGSLWRISDVITGSSTVIRKLHAVRTVAP